VIIIKNFPEWVGPAFADAIRCKDAKFHINTGTLGELQMWDEIGPATADVLNQFRQQAPFTNMDDLTKRLQKKKTMLRSVQSLPIDFA